MKKILTVLTLVVIVATGCETLKGTNQQTIAQGSKEVPAIRSFYLDMPIIKQLGEVKIVHDMNNASLNLYRGEEQTLLNRMTKWLDENIDPDEARDSIPIVLVGGTDILPFISLTDVQYEKLGPEDQELYNKLAEYKRYTVTTIKFKYVETLTEREKADYGYTTVEAPVKVQRNTNSVTPSNTGNPNRRRVKG